MQNRPWSSTDHLVSVLETFARRGSLKRRKHQELKKTAGMFDFWK